MTLGKDIEISLRLEVYIFSCQNVIRTLEIWNQKHCSEMSLFESVFEFFPENAAVQQGSQKYTYTFKMDFHTSTVNRCQQDLNDGKATLE